MQIFNGDFMGEKLWRCWDLNPVHLALASYLSLRLSWSLSDVLSWPLTRSQYLATPRGGCQQTTLTWIKAFTGPGNLVRVGATRATLQISFFDRSLLQFLNIFQCVERDRSWGRCNNLHTSSLKNFFLHLTEISFKLKPSRSPHL